MYTCVLSDNGVPCTNEYETLAEALRVEVQSCRDVPGSRSPLTLYRDGKVVCTVIPCDLDIIVVTREGDVEHHAK